MLCKTSGHQNARHNKANQQARNQSETSSPLQDSAPACITLRPVKSSAEIKQKKDTGARL